MGMAYTLSGYATGPVNPLDGRPLAPGQVLVTGPLATGPRVTVVSSSNPASWPRWVQQDAAGRPVDTGAIPGGSWDGTGAQMLPDLVSTAAMPWWGWFVVLGVAYALVFGKGKGRHEW